MNKEKNGKIFIQKIMSMKRFLANFFFSIKTTDQVINAFFIYLDVLLLINFINFLIKVSFLKP